METLFWANWQNVLNLSLKKTATQVVASSASGVVLRDGRVSSLERDEGTLYILSMLESDSEF